MSAPSPQVLGGTSYAFASWSDGGAQTHNVTAGPEPATLTATYNAAGPSGLSAAYGFNAGSGTTAVDASGNGHTGTISGATWTAAGKFGGALSFDGTNDWVTVADAAALDLTTGMTLMAWVYPTAHGRDVAQRPDQGACRRRGLQPLRQLGHERAHHLRRARRGPDDPLDARGTAQLP